MCGWVGRWVGQPLGGVGECQAYDRRWSLTHSTSADSCSATCRTQQRSANDLACHICHPAHNTCQQARQGARVCAVGAGRLWLVRRPAAGLARRLPHPPGAHGQPLPLCRDSLTEAGRGNGAPGQPLSLPPFGMSGAVQRPGTGNGGEGGRALSIRVWVFHAQLFTHTSANPSLASPLNLSLPPGIPDPVRVHGVTGGHGGRGGGCQAVSTRGVAGEGFLTWRVWWRMSSAEHRRRLLVACQSGSRMPACLPSNDPFIPPHLASPLSLTPHLISPQLRLQLPGAGPGAGQGQADPRQHAGAPSDRQGGAAGGREGGLAAAAAATAAATVAAAAATAAAADDDALCDHAHLMLLCHATGQLCICAGGGLDHEAEAV